MERRISFNSYDGTDLVGIYTGPNNGKIKSAFLLMHGIPSEKNEWGFYSDMAKFFADNGHSSFRFDFRYNGESQQDSLTKLTLSEMVNDVEAAYQTLFGEIDKNIPVLAVGTSCGGGITIKWCNTFKRKIKKVFLMAPVLDYEYEVTGRARNIGSFGPNSSLPSVDISSLREKGYLNPEIKYGREMVNEAHVFDANTEIDLLKTNVVIFQGTSDSVVPIQITKNLIKNARNVELVAIESADHGFAVKGDDNLTDPRTKKNHQFVYQEMLSRLG